MKQHIGKWSHDPNCPACLQLQQLEEEMEDLIAKGELASEGAWIVEVYRVTDGQTYLYQFENEPTDDQVKDLVEEDDLVEVKYANRVFL